MTRSTRRTGSLGALALLATSCAGMTAEDAAHYGCIAGTMLNVAANNFGGQYLNDAATLVSLFADTRMSAAYAGVPSGPRPGCRPDPAAFAASPPPAGSGMYGPAPGAYPGASGMDPTAPAYGSQGYDMSGAQMPGTAGATGMPDAYGAQADMGMPDAHGAQDATGMQEAGDAFGSGAGDPAGMEDAYGAADVQAMGFVADPGGMDDLPGVDPNIVMRESPLALDVALIRHSEGEGAPTPIADGDVLVRADRDRFQIFVAPVEEAYVYIYAVDSTAWIQRLHPDPERGHANPVQPGADVVLPRPGYFFALDEYEGIQEIWFLASRTPRPDIEQTLAAFPLGRERPASVSPRGPGFDRITQPSVLSRGLLEVGPGPPTPVQGGSGADHELTPTRLLARPAAEEIAFSRWFRHE